MDSLLELIRSRRAELEVAAARERDDEEAQRLEGNLIEVVEAAWPAIDPAEYQPCWAIDALCEHLQAVSEGQIRHLLVNAPPRTSKTTLASIFYPAWTWAQSERTFLKGPQVRFLCGSYNHDLSLTNSNSTRRLILSPWFQSLWGHRFNFREDQNTKTKFDTSAGGARLASSVGGSLLGIGGDILIVDDPHNTEEAESDADRKTALTWWKELSTTRLNNPKQSPLIVIMQRLHEEDVSGHILSSEWSGDWCHLMIPMQYEHRRHCVTVLGWQDPRGLDDNGEKLPEGEIEEREGTLLWPERFGAREVARIKAELGPYFSSGRLQQMPVPDKGGIFQRDWWQVWEDADNKFPACDHIVVSIDGAFTEKEENDPTACTVWGCFERDEREIPKIILMSGLAQGAAVPRAHHHEGAKRDGGGFPTAYPEVLGLAGVDRVHGRSFPRPHRAHRGQGARAISCAGAAVAFRHQALERHRRAGQGRQGCARVRSAAGIRAGACLCTNSRLVGSSDLGTG